MIHYPNIEKFDETNYYKVGRLPKPIPESMYNELFSKGVIPKKDLIIGNYYLGRCRNASVAKWDGDKFLYMRNKFGHWSIDKINHMEDDNGYDLFVPLKVVEPTEKQIVNI
jgi:hypothetical protein